MQAEYGEHSRQYLKEGLNRKELAGRILLRAAKKTKSKDYARRKAQKKHCVRKLSKAAKALAKKSR